MLAASPPRDHWYIAARSRDLDRRPLGATVLGEPLALFRADGGRAASLADRCAHRNLALSRGRLVEGRLECAYHGWRYSASGACVEIPSLGAGPGRLSVPAYPVAEAGGFVWVFVGEKAPPGAPRPFPHESERGYTTFVMKNRFEAGAFACLENFLDCPHTAYVHRGLFRSPRARDVAARVSTSRDEVRVEFDERPERDSLVKRLLFPKKRALAHTDRFLMPTTSRVDYHFGPDWHFVITSQCTPVTVDTTDVYTVVSFRAGRLGPLVRLFFEPLCRRIIRQDLDVLKAQTDDIRRFGGPRFTSVASDLVGPQIVRMWREVRPRPSPPVRHAEIEAPPVSRDVVLRF
jgi:phenylpropionate dioxygenase-like ring-hydroxylating dioxygenase large terminal subunit